MALHQAWSMSLSGIDGPGTPEYVSAGCPSDNGCSVKLRVQTLNSVEVHEYRNVE